MVPNSNDGWGNSLINCLLIISLSQRIFFLTSTDILWQLKQNAIRSLLSESAKDLKKKFFYYCCAGWGYIVAFTKVLTLYQANNIVAFTKILTMYEIYHTWIHPFNCSLSSRPPNSWNSFNRYHFCIYIHVYTLFASYSPSYPFPYHLSLPIGVNPLPHPSGQDLFALLFSCFVEEKS
jgi:hypothetical protein